MLEIKKKTIFSFQIQNVKNKELKKESRYVCCVFSTASACNVKKNERIVRFSPSCWSDLQYSKILFLFNKNCTLLIRISHNCASGVNFIQEKLSKLEG